MQNRLEICATALRSHGFEVITTASADEAGEIIIDKVKELAPNIVGFGDSMTMHATGALKAIDKMEGITLLNGFDSSMPRAERVEIRRQAILSDLFITGINAISLSGSLLWLDMVGNRIAPIAFGPHHVILVSGSNKICDTVAQAEERIRTIAAPQNVARHEGFRTPCAKTGVCMDCNSPDRICNTYMRMERCFPEGRITVILIDKELGL